MSAIPCPNFVLPEQYSELVADACALGIADLVFRDLPLESVADYAANERVPPGFPRAKDHFVIADFLIDLPVIAVDLSPLSDSYGYVLAYTYGEFWLIADSMSDFVSQLKLHQDGALWGKSTARA